MSRTVHLPELDFSKSVLPIESGGTAAPDLLQAAQNLSILTNAMVGMPGGPVALTASGKLPAEVVELTLGANVVNVSGEFSVVRGASSILTITDYDSFKSYEIAVSAGSFTRDGATITYTAPTASQLVTLNINGRTLPVVVTGPLPNKPVLTGAASGDVGTAALVSLTTSAYSNTGYSVSGGVYSVTEASDVHLSSDWQVATDAAFANIVFQSSDDLVNLTSRTVSGLLTSTTYYCRARHRSNTSAVSLWSNTSTFVTAASYSLTIEEAKLSAQYASSGNLAGYSARLSGDGLRVVMGAPSKGTGAVASGEVSIFRRDGLIWTQEASIRASDFATSNYLGRSVSINADGTRAAAAAPGNNSGAANKGAVYIFTRNTSTNAWTQEAKLIASDGALGDLLGDEDSLAMDSAGTRVVAGTVRNDHGVFTDPGAAYVFVRNTATNAWTQEAKVVSPAPGASFFFGSGVSITADGATMVIGASGSGIPDPGFGQQVYTTAGTYTFTVPAGVASISMVAVAGGAGSTLSTQGGGGGSLSYKNNVPVTPGEQFTVVVGAGGAVNGGNGGNTTITRVNGGLTIFCPGGKGSGASTSTPTGGDFNNPGGAGTVSYVESSTRYNLGAGGLAYYETAVTPDQASIAASGGTSQGNLTVSGVTYSTSFTDLPATKAASIYGFGQTTGRVGWGGSILRSTQTTRLSQAGNAGGVRFVWGDSKIYTANVVESAVLKTGEGAAFVFNRTGSTWTSVATILPSTLVAGARFGKAVAISADGSRIAVGAWAMATGSGTGRAYIYRNISSAWTEETELQGSSRSSSDYMGFSVSLNADGSVCAVGEYAAVVAAVRCGAMYIYTRTGVAWTETAKLSPSDKAVNAKYGYSTSLSANGLRAAAGSSEASYSGTAMGGVYVIRK